MRKIYLLFSSLSLCSIVYGQDFDESCLQGPTFHSEPSRKSSHEQKDAGDDHTPVCLSTPTRSPCSVYLPSLMAAPPQFNFGAPAYRPPHYQSPYLHLTSANALTRIPSYPLATVQFYCPGHLYAPGALIVTPSSARSQPVFGSHPRNRHTCHNATSLPTVQETAPAARPPLGLPVRKAPISTSETVTLTFSEDRTAVLVSQKIRKPVSNATGAAKPPATSANKPTPCCVVQ